MKQFRFFKLTSPFLEAFFKVKRSFNLKTACQREVNKRFLRFHGHITDCLVGSPLTSKNPRHKRPVFPRILHFRCGNSCTIARFTMAVHFSFLKRNKNLSSQYLWVNFRNVPNSLGQYRKIFGGLWFNFGSI